MLDFTFKPHGDVSIKIGQGGKMHLTGILLSIPIGYRI